MYLYPSITLPIAAIKAAQREGQEPDEFYCLRLLDATGVCVVPGSGFGQRYGTFHFRITFLAPGTDWIDRVVHFHEKFMRDFGEEV
jgi:alanine transaminase